MSQGVAVGAPVRETERMSQTQLPIFAKGTVILFHNCHGYKSYFLYLYAFPPPRYS